MNAKTKQKSPVISFRSDLTKIMPGYSWIVHKSRTDSYMDATGTKSSGFNRLSTLSVTRRESDGVVSYEAKSAGFGLRAPWLATNTGHTLAQALRGLQDQYEQKAALYAGHARALATGRTALSKTGDGQ